MNSEKYLVTTGVKFKLNFDNENDKREMNEYFNEYAKVVTFAARKINEIRSTFVDIPRKKVDDKWVSTEIGICSKCNEETELQKSNVKTKEKLCFSCYNKEYGKQMIRKKILSTKRGWKKTGGPRKVDPSFNVKNAGTLSDTTYNLAARDASQLLSALQKQITRRKQFLRRDRNKLRKFIDILENPDNRFPLPMEKRQRVQRFVHVEDKEKFLRGWTLNNIKNKVNILQRNIERIERSLSKSALIEFKGTKISLHKDIKFDFDNNRVRLNLWKPKFYGVNATNVANKHGIKFFSEKIKKIQSGKYGILVKKIIKNRGAADIKNIEFYLQYPINEEVQQIEPKSVMGVDLGLNKIAAISVFNLDDMSKPCVVKIFSREDKNLRVQRRKQLYFLRGKHNRLQKLRRIRPIEPKIKQYYHTITKRIVDIAKENKSAIVIERLEDMRKKAKIRQRKEERYNLSLFTYKILRNMLEYKAKIRGLPLILVDPEGTSYTCSKCGSFNTIRPFNGSYSSIHCNDCMGQNKMLDADYNASVNIAKKGLNIMSNK